MRKMTSRSRDTQEKLAKLEKGCAPFEDQLVEAAKFVGVDLDVVGRSQDDRDDTKGKCKAFTDFAKEKWVLRWLLKKLQAPKDAAPRKLGASWRLLNYVVQTLPVASSAKILTERSIIAILSQTLEEAHNTDGNFEAASKKQGLEASPGEEGSSKKSKKRRRSGELIAVSSENNGPQLSILMDISAAITTLADKTNASFLFETSAEHMKTVLRTTGEESAKILGFWIALSSTHLAHTDASLSTWLLPFIKIWELRSTGSGDLMHFSLHCTQHLLKLLGQVKQEESTLSQWVPDLEQLVARNIILPAKAAISENPDSDVLSTSTRLSVIQDSLNASILFDVAIVSLASQATHKRRPEDNVWLQVVFTTLKDAMPAQKADHNGKAIQSMLESALNNKVEYELPVLHSIVSDYVFSGNTTNWKLLSTIIKLDGNTFLIPGGEKDLLQEVLTRITAVCIEPTWANSSKQVVFDVVVPLMKEFAKARDLSGFIRHWYAQLVAFEKLREEKGGDITPIFSAWEDDGIQAELKRLLEPSLNVQQIKQILDWLATQVSQSSNSVCVILEAISGSVSRQEVVDAVGLRLYHIMFDNGSSEKLTERYKWRSWRILSRSLYWLGPADIENISKLWEDRWMPFDRFEGKIGNAALLKTTANDTVGLDNLELLRFACVAFGIASQGSRMNSLAKEYMLNLFHRLAQDVKTFLKSLRSTQDLGKEICGSAQNTLDRGIGWMMWAIVLCVFVENPKVPQIGMELQNHDFKELLQGIFWIASVTPSTTIPSDINPWFRVNQGAFAKLWTSFLSSDLTQNNEATKGTVIDIILSCQTNKTNPLVKSPENNVAAIQSLLILPLDIIHVKERERIMKAWLPETSHSDQKEISYDSTALDPLVLSLKVKVMHRTTFYEGLKYKELVSLADALTNAKTSSLQVNLGLFKQLAILTLNQMTANLDRPRNREYAMEAIDYLKLIIEKKNDTKGKSKDKWSYATITLFEATLTSLTASREALSNLAIMNSNYLTSITETFKDSLLAQFHRLLHKRKKLKGDHKPLSVVPIIDALTALGIDGAQLAALSDDAESFISSLPDSENDLKLTITDFFTTHLRNNDGEIVDAELKGDITTFRGRNSILKKTKAAVERKDQDDRLELLESLCLKIPDFPQIDTLLAVRNVVALCRDARADEDDKSNTFDLASLYSELCSKMWRVNSYRQFAIISETLEMMLRTKGRAISQWNIDSTLGSISIMCSRNGPHIRHSQAGNVYMHLCHLLQAILTSHRLKLQGHFHLIVQSMQALICCLFTPLPHSNSRLTKLFAPPPWLPISSSQQLNAHHAAAFTRLITLICNPSVSSVTRSQHNALTSATDKAKRMAGQHMQYVLTSYIKLQLEMTMLPAVREQMAPGIYAIFDTTTPELRRAINDSMDSSGRAVFRTLYSNYTKFGKWKGS